MRLLDINQSLNIAMNNLQTATIEEFSDNFRIKNTYKLKIDLDKLLSMKFIQINKGTKPTHRERHIIIEFPNALKEIIYS